VQRKISYQNISIGSLHEKYSATGHLYKEVSYAKEYHLAIFLAFTLLIGCAGLTPPFEPQAFGPEKTYAIASIYCEPTIEVQDIETMESAIKAIKGKGAHRFSAKSVLENSTPVIVQEFAGSLLHAIASSLPSRS
jgi:hypothetical protein